jgi:hypothetical protein
MLKRTELVGCMLERTGLVGRMLERTELIGCMLEITESDFIAPFAFDEGCEENIWT